jgi:hypothetical protein
MYSNLESAPTMPALQPHRGRKARGGVLVLGGGFAGAYVARKLGRAGATIVNPTNFMLYTPLLPEAARATSSRVTSSCRIARCAPTRTSVLGLRRRARIPSGAWSRCSPRTVASPISYESSSSRSAR